MTSILTKLQAKIYGPKIYTEDGERYKITATVRYDDQCDNGHNSFSIRGDIRRSVNGFWKEDSCGCVHDDIRTHFPELAPFLKWHGMTSEGPPHYLANTTYFAGERDCHGLLKGEQRQLINGRTKQPCWELLAIDEAGNELPTYRLPGLTDSPTPPTSVFRLEWRPCYRIGEGKARELDAARRAAIWPDATDEDLTAPGLRERLRARLPKLLDAFQQDLATLGLTF